MVTNGSKVSKNINGLEVYLTDNKHLFLDQDVLAKTKDLEYDDEIKIKLISKHFKQIMLLLGLDLDDKSLAGTPDRVAKMFITEMFSGLNPANKPKITLFDNDYKYNEMLIEKNITLYSCCEHHFVPISAKLMLPIFRLVK
ncbi:MAG TPA: GTP cyclohydrolase I [Segetibacter sp.]|nr:GTP cyclohydrolase I [Segetibacter sp.]